MLRQRTIAAVRSKANGRVHATQLSRLPGGLAIHSARSYVSKTHSPEIKAPSYAVHRPLPTGLPVDIPDPNLGNVTVDCVDGSYATAHVAYSLSDVAFIYPITPSSVMGELTDVWMAQKRENVFGQVVEVREMQSEGGAAGAVHGALVSGAMATTFTASQGLLLMVPNLYKIAGELLPCVIHVAARAIAGQALSIFGDHSDVMACRQTGFALLSSHTVQQTHDFALIAHLATLHASVPFIHFFDGFRTSHEINKIQMLPKSAMRGLVPVDKIREHWSRALNPMHPHLRGTNQGPDIFFQLQEAANRYYLAVPDIVQQVMQEVGEVTGRKYRLFEYYGPSDAKAIIVLMGAGTTSVKETIEYANARGEKWGMIAVHLYRPWSAKHFLAELPPSVERIAVLDRTKESGALGEPLFLDIVATLQTYPSRPLVVGGRYGLGNKDLTPQMVMAVFRNLVAPEPRSRFTVGIKDDVTNLSLDLLPEDKIDTVPGDTTECIFWGIGSDGTVGANKTAIKLIGNQTELHAQGYFAIDAFKSGGVTTSHLRFGKSPITAQYLIQTADYIACHHCNYVHKFKVADNLKEGGTFVLNSPWSADEMERELPASLKRQLYEKKARFYNVDARSFSDRSGLGKRINTVMQTVFFKLSNVLPLERAIHLLKEAVYEEYGKKGDTVVQNNIKAIESIFTTQDAIQEIPIPPHWKDAKDNADEVHLTGNDFVDNVMMPLMHLEGGVIPVSKFEPGGVMPLGLTKYTKRAIAQEVPVWKANHCTQCNYCSFACPHAVIRPFVLTDKELEHAPQGFETRKAREKAFTGMSYRIQVAPMDCTGCRVCVEVCPDDALAMAPIEDVLKAGGEQLWEFAQTLPERGHMVEKATVRGSQFQPPLLEFSGACEGCGQTPYVKLLTQLFGQRMVIANATGCSSIWGGTAALTPYTTNKRGRGPAWGNSLFEDNAEYGFGMAIATAQRRSKLRDLIQRAVQEKRGSPPLQKLLNQWVRDWRSGDKVDRYVEGLVEALAAEKDFDPVLQQIHMRQDLLPNIAVWIIGGDGWAYDIGYGGLDHVLASGVNVNVLVLDTEMYSNTGGQASKSSPQAAVAKFALSGKSMRKKDLGMMAMSYEYVYTASVSLGDMSQTVKALSEAEAYEGPSIVLAYAPCIEQGIQLGMGRMVEESRKAVDTGYWPLYRYDPRNLATGKNPFQLDSKRIKSDLEEFLRRENRFANLDKTNPKMAQLMRTGLKSHIQRRLNRYQRMSEADRASDPRSGSGLRPSVTILYGSETGHAEGLAKDVAVDFEKRGYHPVCQALDDLDPEQLPNHELVIIVISTCGQGQFPKNASLFWKWLQTADKPEGWLSGTKFAVFGLGDSAYYFFNEAARKVDQKLALLGAKRVVPLGLGDDLAEEGLETGVNEWLPTLWHTLGTKTPESRLFDSLLHVEECHDTAAEPWQWPGTESVKCLSNERITPLGHDRNFVAIKWERPGALQYNLGDSLGIYPANPRPAVVEFLQWYGLQPNTVIRLGTAGGTTRLLPEVVAVGELFTKVLDLFGKPNRRFYEALSHFATDPGDKARLVLMSAGEGEYKHFFEETMTYADVLRAFPSARPPLNYLIEMVPDLKPRYYSISSSPNANPSQVHSLVLIDTWVTPEGKHRTGLTCTMLEGIKQGTTVPAFIHRSAMEFPSDDTVPMVMAGIGSGLAPFVAFIQDRYWKHQQGKKVGKMVLYFGNRFRQSEFLLEEELQQYVASGILTLRTAFSRDARQKVYVQDLIRKDPELIHELLVRQKGYMYVCGSRQMPKPVQASVQYCFQTAGGLSNADAEHWVVDMFTSGRYNIESW
eukprot:TRINITY_DN30672_c0_g1_i1.p1 TRINITY_DN30672_c0_g1~~TRINITY_DN30672_c0_g1_i1.p1  ORF type:complete len:1821 (+),score=321.60 TRINITY_DN30672_c0_g1_i1:35-5497(+)